jgi:hypothetical protein
LKFDSINIWYFGEEDKVDLLYGIEMPPAQKLANSTGLG